MCVKIYFIPNEKYIIFIVILIINESMYHEVSNIEGIKFHMTLVLADTFCSCLTFNDKDDAITPKTL